MEVKARKEMDPAYQWDFSHIFPTREAWEEAYAEAGQAVAAGQLDLAHFAAAQAQAGQGKQRAAGAEDRSVDAAAFLQALVGGINNGVHLHLRDIMADKLNGQSKSLPRLNGCVPLL